MTRTPRHTGSRFGSRRGAVLIVAMWASLALVSLALYFGDSARFAYRGIDNEVAGRQAEQAVASGARYALYLLGSRQDPMQPPELDTYLYEDVPVGDAGFWFLGRPEDDLAYEDPVFGLVDEASRLNLNTAPAAWLESLPEMTPELAAAIVDWRDEDDELTDGGAEAQTYLLRDPPITCKNAPFETLEELLLVHGADEDLLYGEDTNENGVLDPNEDDGDESPPYDDGNGVLDRGLLSYLTVYSREPNLQDDGTARINVNEAGEELETLLRETFEEERGNEILQRIQGNQGDHESLVQFYLRSGMTREEFDQVAHALTTSEETYQEGLVNVNTAGATVLACLPGLDEDTAGQLVLHRRTLATLPASEAWIVDVIGEEAARAVGPYVTTRSYQLTADVAAVGRLGRGFRRSRFVIDTSDGVPQIVYRRDLHGLGWALGYELYAALSEMEEGRR